MVLKNIKIAFRNLQKNKAVTAINILGLTIGITICLLIFTYVKKELTTDNYIPNHQNIYALMTRESPHVALEMAQLAKSEVPEITHITSCTNEWAPQVYFSKENINLKIEDLLLADSAFFKVFKFELVWGDLSNALFLANKVVLTQSLAKKMFGDKNPVGETFSFNSSYLQDKTLEVAAVIKDLPNNSSWHFSAVLSLKTDFQIDWFYNNLGWGQQSFYSFISIPENIDVNFIRNKLENLSLKNVPDNYKEYISFGLFPFSKLYFNSPKHDILKHGNYFILSVVEIIGILILLLACFNYINLVTAQRDKRNKIVGIIKTLGTTKRNVVGLLTLESALTILVSLILSILLIGILIGYLNEITGSHFSFGSIFFGWNNLILFSVVAFTLLVTGLIPGYIFSNNKATLLLKNNLKSTKSTYLRNGLLAFQFVISIALISVVLFINRQNNYLANVNPGFEKGNIIYANTNDNILNSIQSFKNELKKIPGIADITFAQHRIGAIDQNWQMDFFNGKENVSVYFALTHVTPNFFDFFGIKIKNGNGFSETSATKRGVLFNSAAFHRYTFLKPGETRFPLRDDINDQIVIGEVEDFNFESMHVPIRPLGFLCSDEGDEVVYLKLNSSGKSLGNTIESLKNVWNRFSPDFPLDYHFLDASWEAFYLQDRQFQKVLSCSTIISIFLSCLGLIGLTFFIIENKTKEIGIRKVNGAKVSEILAMLNKDVIKWVVIAFVIATPVAYYTMNKWLENFAYKTTLSWWIFALSGMLALGIALLTVSWQSWKAATRNPVEALRYE